MHSKLRLVKALCPADAFDPKQHDAVNKRVVVLNLEGMKHISELQVHGKGPILPESGLSTPLQGVSKVHVRVVCIVIMHDNDTV